MDEVPSEGRDLHANVGQGRMVLPAAPMGVVASFLEMKSCGLWVDGDGARGVSGDSGGDKYHKYNVGIILLFYVGPSI